MSAAGRRRVLGPSTLHQPVPAASAAITDGIHLSDLHFSFADGTTVFDGAQADLPDGVTGLIGANGAGKSTLLRLVTGALVPEGGTITAPAVIGVLPQTVGAAPAATVADALGISEVLEALARIEAGDGTPEDFDTVGTDWDVAERAGATLARLGLPGADPARPLRTLSGGQVRMIALAGLLLAAPDALLLDEPTNDLDAPARARLQEALAGFAGPVITVSHDLELLGRVDRIAEVRDGKIRTFTGGYADYRAAIDTEQQAAQRHVTEARADLRRQRKVKEDAQITLARRARYAAKMNRQKNEPKMVMGLRRQAAEVSAGKLRGAHAAAVEEAAETLDRVRREVRSDRRLRIDLPSTALPADRRVVMLDLTAGGPVVGDPPAGRLTDSGGTAPEAIEVRGPERIGLTGDNGSGKTTLLSALVAAADVPTGMLTQRRPDRDPQATVAEEIARLRPGADAETVRAHLARLLFRGRAGDREIGALSGGERLRLELGAVLFAKTAPQLLVLDEPTNDLDIDAVEQLVAALTDWPGALIVVSHDRGLADRLALTRRWHLDTDRAAAEPEPGPL